MNYRYLIVFTCVFATRSTADFDMFLFTRHWIIFPKPKPYILLDTALLIKNISRPRIMTWWRENWRLYHITCEIRSEINGIRNVASYWVSSWDSWLFILRVFFVAARYDFWMNRNSGYTFCLFSSCYISSFLCLLSYLSDNLASLSIATKNGFLELLCLAFCSD